MTKPLGVGVIGLGVGVQHVRAFDALSSCRVLALCDHDAGKLATIGQEWPRARHYARADDLIDDPDVDVVVIASQDDHHYAQVIRAFEAGKHVFVEKPLCLARGELEAIARAWRASGRRLSTNTVLRRSARFRWLKNAISDGRLGQVYLLEADYVYGRLHKMTEGWRGGIPNYSVMLGGGIHMVDLVMWLSGGAPVEVQAVASDRGSRGSGFTGKDLTVALLRFENGLVAKVGANFASVYPHFHRLYVYGTEATFENTPRGDALLWTSRKPEDAPELVTAAYPGVSKGDLVPAFVNAVLGQGEPEVPESEVFAAVAVCLAIDRAAETRKPVTVDYV